LDEQVFVHFNLKAVAQAEVSRELANDALGKGIEGADAKQSIAVKDFSVHQTRPAL
jgi:hypothetical protein